MSVLVDTNVLLRRAQPDHPSHLVAVESVARLVAKGEPTYVIPQNIAEFWNVATRPAVHNGFGFSLDEVRREIGNIESLLSVLADPPAIYEEWKFLVIKHAVQGTKVYDARLVAAMNVHGVPKILTFNGADFKRYDIEIVNPAALA